VKQTSQYGGHHSEWVGVGGVGCFGFSPSVDVPGVGEGALGGSVDPPGAAGGSVDPPGAARGSVDPAGAAAAEEGTSSSGIFFPGSSDMTKKSNCKSFVEKGAKTREGKFKVLDRELQKTRPLSSECR
jgi:hypothetical protein